MAPTPAHDGRGWQALIPHLRKGEETAYYCWETNWRPSTRRWDHSFTAFPRSLSSLPFHPGPLLHCLLSCPNSCWALALRRSFIILPDLASPPLLTPPLLLLSLLSCRCPGRIVALLSRPVFPYGRLLHFLYDLVQTIPVGVEFTLIYPAFTLVLAQRGSPRRRISVGSQ